MRMCRTFPHTQVVMVGIVSERPQPVGQLPVRPVSRRPILPAPVLRREFLLVSPPVDAEGGRGAIRVGVQIPDADPDHVEFLGQREVHVGSRPGAMGRPPSHLRSFIPLGTSGTRTSRNGGSSRKCLKAPTPARRSRGM